MTIPINTKVRIDSYGSLKHGQVGNIIRMTDGGDYVVSLPQGKSVFKESQLSTNTRPKRKNRKESFLY